MLIPSPTPPYPSGMGYLEGYNGTSTLVVENISVGGSGISEKCNGGDNGCIEDVEEF